MEDAMKEEKTLDRREFTLAAALAALSGVAITISACGGSSSPTASSPVPTPAPTPTPAPPAAADKTGVIGSNHGHAGTITAAQLAAGGVLSLNIQGTSAHPHTVDLTAADMTAIAGNQRVSKESSTDNGHSHSVTFN
jgi:hypothetical protein